MKPKRIIKKTTIKPLIINQLDVLNDRAKLRNYSLQNSIKTPDFFVSDDFNKISQWAMHKNSFPLCLKSSKNLNNSDFIYILKAFREMPDFFEKIQANIDQKTVIIEEFIEGKAYLEVTVVAKSVRLISQIGLSKSMKLQQKWRAFPIKLPENIFEKIKKILDKFNELIEVTIEPIRFSFVISNYEPVLISINSDNNRLEYQDEWRKESNLDTLVNSFYPSKGDYISKINIYKLPKETNIDLSKTIEVCDKSKVKYEIINKKLFYMLTAKSSKELAEDFEKVNAIIKQECSM